MLSTPSRAEAAVTFIVIPVRHRPLNTPGPLELRAESFDGPLKSLAQTFVLALSQHVIHPKSIKSSIHLISFKAVIWLRMLHVCISPGRICCLR